MYLYTPLLDYEGVEKQRMEDNEVTVLLFGRPWEGLNLRTAMENWIPAFARISNTSALAHDWPLGFLGL